MYSIRVVLKAGDVPPLGRTGTLQRVDECSREFQYCLAVKELSIMVWEPLLHCVCKNLCTDTREAQTGVNRKKTPTAQQLPSDIRHYYGGVRYCVCVCVLVTIFGVLLSHVLYVCLRFSQPVNFTVHLNQL